MANPRVPASCPLFNTLLRLTQERQLKCAPRGSPCRSLSWRPPGRYLPLRRAHCTPRPNGSRPRLRLSRRGSQEARSASSHRRGSHHHRHRTSHTPLPLRHDDHTRARHRPRCHLRANLRVCPRHHRKLLLRVTLRSTLPHHRHHHQICLRHHHRICLRHLRICLRHHCPVGRRRRLRIPPIIGRSPRPGVLLRNRQMCRHSRLMRRHRRLMRPRHSRLVRPWRTSRRSP